MPAFGLTSACAILAGQAIRLSGELDGGALGAMACLVGYLALLAGTFAYRFRFGAGVRSS